MDHDQPYTRHDWVRAVNLSALLAWAALAGPFIVVGGVPFLIWAMALALPVAYLTCWTIGAPILAYAMRRPIGRRRAALWGAVVSASIAAPVIVIGRYWGWPASMDPSIRSQLGGGDFIRSLNGILTPYGRQVLAQNTAMFILLGVAVALIVRAVIGPGRR